MPALPYIIEARLLIKEMIYRVGIAIEDSSPAVQRLVAWKVGDIEGALHNIVQCLTFRGSN